MVKVAIPGFKALELEHLVLDFNGTLAVDGALLDGVTERVRHLADVLRIHVVTGDTHGSARQALANLPLAIHILEAHDQAQAKLDFLLALGAQSTVCIGNGRNDRLMLKAAALGIVVVQTEGASAQALEGADVVAPRIQDALDLLLQPLRLKATLRG